MTLITNNANQAKINNLIIQLREINGFDDELAVKENYDLLDLIANSDPSGDGGVYCILENEDGLFALQSYNGTNDQGFLPLLSNQQADEDGYAYIVEEKLTFISNQMFRLVGENSYITEYSDKNLNIFLSAKVTQKSGEYLWYSKQDYLEIIKSQLDEFPGFDFEIVKDYLA